MVKNKKADADNIGSNNGLLNDISVSTTDNIETTPQTQYPAGSTLDDFLAAFFPDENETINLRFLDCKTLDNEKLSKQLRKTAFNRSVTRFALKNDAALQNEIQAVNLSRGVYFVVNSGGNSDKEITRFNAFFAESDTRTIEEQHKRLDVAPLKPSIRLETKKSVHAHWLLNGGCTAQEWREMQKRLIAYFDSDDEIKKLAGLMRPPCFNHVSYDETAAKYVYKPVELKEFEPTRRYTLQEMQAAFPVIEKGRAALASPVQSIQDINSIFSTGYENNPQETQEIAEKCLNHLSHERCDARESWLNVGFALRNTFEGGEKGLDLWREWSKKSTAYTEGCCEDVWGGAEREEGAKLTAGSLVYWACENSAEFRHFWQERNGQAAGASAKPTQANRLLKSIIDRLELFHTADGVCFASVHNNGHQETQKLSSRAFKDWLSYECYRQEGKTPNTQAISDVIQTLTGKALFDSPSSDVFLRVAEKDGAVYVDLCDESWRVVQITKDGWQILEHPPVKFRRTKGMLTLPDPLPGGNLKRLKEFINVCDNDFILVLAWLVACFCLNRPYPVLILHGEQGSAKSTTTRFLRRLVDPNKADLREKPKDSRDLVVAANNSYIQAYDNLSALSFEMSDVLCRLSTGGGFSARELYSNDEETIFDVIRPIILNGIEETASRSDLLDRALIIECPRIDGQRRKTEARCKKDFANEHGRLLGALFDAVSCALRNIQSIKIKEQTRMADFAEWACAAEPAFALPGENFLERYQSNRETAHAVTLESSPVGKALLTFMQIRTSWQGTAEELRGLLCASNFETGFTGFPKNAKALGGALKRLAPTLRANRIEITNQRANNARTITITKQI